MTEILQRTKGEHTPIHIRTDQPHVRQEKIAIRALSYAVVTMKIIYSCEMEPLSAFMDGYYISLRQRNQSKLSTFVRKVQ